MVEFVAILCLLLVHLSNLVYSSDTKKIEYNVEILICTDYSVFEMHKKILKSSKWNLIKTETENDLVKKHIKTYYNEIIRQVNDRYESSFKNDPDLNIKISISDFFISENPDDSNWFKKNVYKTDKNETIINGNLALVEFNSWIETNRDQFLAFDHVFGITTMDIVNSDEDLDYNGLAYVYGICKQFFCGSIIEDRGAFESVRSFAHELAHNLGLGAEHDGIASNSECPEWDNYIMSSKYLPYNQANSWLLSKCSISKIKEFLSHEENNYCLLNKPKQLNQASNYEMYPGQIYNSYDQCKHLHGPNSTPCFEYESSFCQNLYCHKNGTNSECVWVAPATEGTECGKNGWCIRGKCETRNNVEEKPKFLVKKQETEFLQVENNSQDYVQMELEQENCMDVMNAEFCDTVFLNDYCGEMFYWNGRKIGKDWCRKKCQNCD